MLNKRKVDRVQAFRRIRNTVCVLFATILMSHRNAVGQPQDACAKLYKPQTAQQIHFQKVAISRKALRHSAPGDVHIMRTLSEARWTVVFAQIQGAEQGLFFFHGIPRPHALVSVWGGSPGAESVADIASTLDPNLPATLKACIAETIHRTF